MDIKILIIEDEFLIREQLSKINWKSTGAVLSGSFADTQSAWNFAKNNHPDILITDIKLDNENGLEFANKLKSRLPNLKIIILTAYNIVEYTKTAIDVGVLAYLLKPIDTEQLINTTKTAVELVKKDRQNIILGNIANSFKENKYLLKNYFLSACSNEHYNQEEIYSLFGVPANDSLCSTIVVQINGDNDIFEIFMNIKTLLENNSDYYIFPFYEPKHLVFFVKFKFSLDIDAALLKCIEISNIIKNHLDFNYSSTEINYSIGIGEIINTVTEFEKSYKSGLNCLEHSFYMGKNQIIYCQDVEPSTDIIGYKELISNCISALKIGNETVSLNQIDKLFDDLKKTADIETVQRICLELIVNISTALIQIGQDPNYLFNKFDVWSYLKRCTTLESLKTLINNIVSTSIAQINDIRSTKTSKLICEITEYLNENYTQPLFLEEVAKKFFVSPCYLSTIFKQETNVNFKEYIRMLKINKAKELLTKTNYTIQEIAQKLGYNSSSYFSKTFLHETGYVPSEYRINNKE